MTSNEKRGVSQLLKEARDTLLQSAKLERDKKNIGYALFYLDQARSSLGLQSLREKGELENEELYTKPQDLEDKIDQILHLLQDSNKAQPFLQPSLEVQASQQKTWAQVTSFPPTSPTPRTGDWTLV